MISIIPFLFGGIKVCLEGGIPKSVSDGNKSRGERPSGDLVPWALALQYLDTSLTEQVSARVIRVAAHPDYQVRFLIIFLSILLLLSLFTVIFCLEFLPFL